MGTAQILDLKLKLMHWLTDCLIFWIFSVKSVENSLQALVDWRSGATVTGGIVNLSTVANKACALFLFLLMIRKARLTGILQFWTVITKFLLVDVIKNLQICLSQPSFSFTTLFFHFFCPWWFFLSRDNFHFSGSNGINYIWNFGIKFICQLIHWATG